MVLGQGVIMYYPKRNYIGGPGYLHLRDFYVELNFRVEGLGIRVLDSKQCSDRALMSSEDQGPACYVCYSRNS